MRGLVGVFQRPDVYEASIKVEMKRLGASKVQFERLTPDLIWDSFTSKIRPWEVAHDLCKEE